MKKEKWRVLAEKHLPYYESLCPQAKNRAGIYMITVDDVPVYVGQSKNLLLRIASHESAIYDKENDEYNKTKYKLLREAKEKGHSICFEILHYVSDEDLPLLDIIEAWNIDKYNPPLNIIHPEINGHPTYHDNNYKNYTDFERYISGKAVSASA